MKRLTLVLLLFAAILSAQTRELNINFLSTHFNGTFDEGATEIAAFDPETSRLFVTNGEDGTIDIFTIGADGSITSFAVVDLSSYGDGANSVAVKNGIVAAAVEAEVSQDNGKIVFFDTDGNYLNDQEVGALPDMVTFTPNGQYVLAACEGEPNDDYSNDPEGSVAIIDISNINDPIANLATFDAFNGQTLEPSIRIFGPSATVAQDLEPEYIAISDDSQTAWVTCQENNAIAIIDIPTHTVTALKGLGFKDHSVDGNGLDASNDDDAINIATWPVYGMYQPDAIAYYNGYLFTANEGDAREYDTFEEEEKVKDVVLDPTAFPNAATLQENENLGKLKITNTLGDTDNDGDYDELYCYGARSFSIYNAAGEFVWDSGDQFEQQTAIYYPDYFNSNNDDNDSFDSRSDDKGPEPEGITVGMIDNEAYALIGLERISGFMIYNVTNPEAPVFVDYINNRDFTGDPEQGTAGDLAPEGILFVPSTDSPTGTNLIITSNEVSGTISIFEISSTSINDDVEEMDFELVGNYPNPFNPETSISFTLKNNASVKLTVFDANGSIVSVLNNGQMAKGKHNVVFNASELSTGVYFYSLNVDGLSQTKKMLFIK